MSFTNMTVLNHGRTIRDEFLFPDNEYRERIERVGEIMDSENLDGLLIYTDSLSRGNVCYLSGFTNYLAWSVSMMILPRDGDPVVVAAIAPRDVTFTKQFLPGFVELVSAGLSLVSNEHISAKAIEYMKEKGLIAGKKWGCVNFGRLPRAAADPWKEVFPGGFTECDEKYAIQRAHKSERETYVISQASAVAKRAVYEFMRQARPGVGEAALAAKIDREQRINGANSVSLLVSAGKTGETSLHTPRERDFEDGDTVSVYADIGLQYYHGSFGTTKVIGAMDKQKEDLMIQAGIAKSEKIADMILTGKSQIGQQDQKYMEYECYTIVNGIGGDLVEYPYKFGGDAALDAGMALSLSLSMSKKGVGAVFFNENYTVAGENGEISLISLSGPGR